MNGAVQRARSSWRPITARRVRSCLLLAATCCIPARYALPARSQAPVQLSETTEYNAFARDWWPTKGTPPIEAYAGARVCEECHAERASTQVTTPMAHAAYRSAVGAWGAKPTTAT